MKFNFESIKQSQKALKQIKGRPWMSYYVTFSF